MKCSKCGGNNEDGSLKCTYCDSNLLENSKNEKQNINSNFSYDDYLKAYKISRYILVIFAYVLMFLYYIICRSDLHLYSIIIEDYSFYFAAVVYIISFPSTIISVIFFDIGNLSDNKLIRILCYCIIFPGVLFLFFKLMHYIIFNILVTSITSFELYMFLNVVCVLFAIIPYLQTLIVLRIIRITKKNE